MITKPDYEAAAIKALDLLKEKRISEAPIVPLPFLMEYEHVRVISFSTITDNTEINRDDLIPMFGAAQDAATFHLNIPSMEDVQYVVAYNRCLPYEVIWRGLARELGHIALGHDGTTRTIEVRMAEAKTFAHHLLSPRPIIHMLQESGMPLTMNMLSSVTCCSDECVNDLQDIPCIQVPAQLNREVRDLFAPGIREYLRFHRASPRVDKSPVVDFGTFMDGYME